MIASLGYAALTYWPIFFPTTNFVPQTGFEAAEQAPLKPANAPAAPTAETKAPLVLPPPPDIKLVDPFALRINVRRPGDEPAKPATPTAPAGEEKPLIPKLEGIWWDVDMKVAFISGQAVPVGGTIMGWQVVAIAKDHVTIRKGSSTKVLKMEEK
jgi:hypothetical protein